MTRKELSFLLWLLILIAIMVFAASCRSTNGLLRHAERDIQKAIAKGATVDRDTVFHEKQVVVPRVEKDTIFRSVEKTNLDTVYIAKDRLKLKYVDLPGDTVFLSGECATDTVWVKVPVQVDTTIKAGHGFWYDVKLAGIFLVVGALAMFILMRAGPLRNFNITIENRKPP